MVVGEFMGLVAATGHHVRGTATEEVAIDHRPFEHLEALDEKHLDVIGDCELSSCLLLDISRRININQQFCFEFPHLIENSGCVGLVVSDFQQLTILALSRPWLLAA
jgi:hypothetical protein